MLILCFIRQIKFLKVEYFLGKLNCMWKNIEERRSHLISAKSHFNAFFKTCKLHQIVSEQEHYDVDLPSNRESPEERRHRKIAKYKQEKEARERLRVFSFFNSIKVAVLNISSNF